MSKIAVVTGSSRGLGLAAAKGMLAKGFEVICAQRDASRDSELGKGSHLRSLDTQNPDSVIAFVADVLKEFRQVDVLINNAGIFVDSQDPLEVAKSFATNVLGPVQLIRAFLPGMKSRNFGRVVNVSSGMGQLSEMQAGYLAYRVSKTALNAVSKVFASECLGQNVLINSVCPGWVRTDMGGAGATRSIEEGVSGMLWAATLPDGGPSGGFFRDGKPLPW